MRIAAFNALLIVAGLALIAAAGEMYFRMSVPYGFIFSPKDFSGGNSWRFVPNVGMMPEPNSEARYTDHRGYWMIARSNSLGFLDRELISPGRAAESCHIAFIGDSFAEGKEVAIADKAQVKLEERAARDLPHLDVTTSAFGLSATGQINQLAFYDEYAQHLRPKVLALVFGNNDFSDNSTILDAIDSGLDPDHMPWVTAEKGTDGALELRPPDPDYEKFRLPPRPGQAQTDISAIERAKNQASKHSYFAQWLGNTIRWTFPNQMQTLKSQHVTWKAEQLSRRPRYSKILQGWPPSGYTYISQGFRESNMPPVFEDALEYTKFGLERFKRRAERDDAKLVILAVHRMKMWGGGSSFNRLTAIADELGIPVIDQHEYIIRMGAKPKDAQLKYDIHWGKNGHKWAAEALLEWLKDNQDVCD